MYCCKLCGSIQIIVTNGNYFFIESSACGLTLELCYILMIWPSGGTPEADPLDLLCETDMVACKTENSNHCSSIYNPTEFTISFLRRNCLLLYNYTILKHNAWTLLVNHFMLWFLRSLATNCGMSALSVPR